MDIKCHKCGEPWGVDSLHDAVAEGHAADFEDARKAFYRDGCAGIGSSCGEPLDGGRSALLAELAALSGDDIDGFAADLEDFGL